MREKVAKAIGRALSGVENQDAVQDAGPRVSKGSPFWKHYELAAEAAMEAMSHPSEEMTALANAMEANYKVQLKSFEVTGFCWLIYRAMILKALER